MSALSKWWRDAVVYQIYPRSFRDASGDGIGDLRGVIAELDCLVELGVDAIWLSPFYTSPQNDAGYDVADYRDVDPLFGTLADADEMIAAAHERGLRVMVDLVPNHTSDAHPWFQEALAAGPGSPERDRYMFRPGRGEGGEEPPNNWRSIFGGEAWTRVCDRKDAPGSPWEGDGSWYLNLFDSSQPDLNWENEEVRAEFDDVLRFWLARGIDGFRVDVAHGLVKRPGLPDWDGHVSMVEGNAPAGTASHPAGLEGIRTADSPMFDQDGVHDVYQRWRRVLDEFEGERILVAEAWVEPLSRLALYVREDEMQQAFNFAFLITEFAAGPLRQSIEASLAENAAVGATTTWVLSNHDVVRHATRLGLDRAHFGANPAGVHARDPQPDAAAGLQKARAATLLMLGLPGSAYLYQGEELGLPEHTTLDDSLRQDPAFFRTKGGETGRDGCRVPLPWRAAEPGLGFSPTGATWLPQPEVYAQLARDVQRGKRGSTLEMYRAALRLRRQHGMGARGLEWLEVDGALAFVSTPASGSPTGGMASAADAAETGAAAGDAEAAAVVDAGPSPDVLVLTAFEAPVTLPEGWRVALASDPLSSTQAGAVQVPAYTTVWAERV